MKEVLSLFTFAIGALCFVVFVARFKPDAISAVPAPTKLARCSTQASSPPACRPHVLTALAADLMGRP